MLRTAKNTGINDIDPQLDMIYINIDLSLRMFLQRPIERFIIDLFLSDLDDRKYKWWAYASKKVDSSYRSKKPQYRDNSHLNNGQRSQYSS